MRVASYSRVSTERDQNPEAQRIELSRYVLARGWDLTEEIVDHGFSGGTDQRPGLKRLMALARSRRVDVVIVTKLDRLARSLRHLVSLMDEFSALGIQFISLQDQIDMTTASGRLMLHLIGAFAEFERALIRERTRLGLAHARSKGSILGRPRLHDQAAIRALREDGKSYRAIAKLLGAPMGSIVRAIKDAPKTSLLSESKTSMRSRRRSR